MTKKTPTLNCTYFITKVKNPAFIKNGFRDLITNYLDLQCANFDFLPCVLCFVRKTKWKNVTESTQQVLDILRLALFSQRLVNIAPSY